MSIRQLEICLKFKKETWARDTNLGSDSIQMELKAVRLKRIIKDVTVERRKGQEQSPEECQG